MSTELQHHWHGRRKVWHINATLAILPLFFLLKFLLPVAYFLGVIFAIAWTVSLALIIVDLFRIYRPGVNDVILSMPLISFFRSIWREHEKWGYAASTYSVLAVTIVISLLFFGLIGEPVLIAAVAVMALCDPAASLARYLLQGRRSIIIRLGGFVAFVICCYLILLVVGLFYHALSADMFLAAAIAAGFCEAYIPRLWHLAVSRWQRRFGRPPLPLWALNIYFDDNLTAPLALTAVLMFFGC